ncbi:ABC transporter permease [Methanobacterium sp. SMA-27]|uniref:ABC transporter permease n=1 Tax=Methanobacterium sp. SMA-27 TaxID=1495336 RepID=UPI00064E1875|nr:ABC transporter permease [Methanobacterium sp. SMA-27]
MLISTIKDHRFIDNFNRYRYLLIQLIIRNIKLRYRRSVLGIFWSFLEPLLSMIVLTIIFSSIFKGFGVSNYPVYLLIGRLIFQLYSTATTAAISSITGNSGIIKKVYIPKYIFTIAGVLSSVVTFLLSLVVLLLVMIATHVHFTIYMIFASLPLIALVFFIIGTGLILATLAVFFRDIRHLYGVFITLLMYATPIFYPPQIVPESFRFIQTLNPIYAAIVCCRTVVLDGTLYDPSTLLFLVGSAIFTMVLGIALFYKYQDRFILHI